MNQNRSIPGPWLVDPNDPHEAISENWGGIVSVPNEPAENEELMAMKLANARLIAAAPTLLEALEWIAHEITSGCNDGQDILDVAQEAIALAIGESK